LFNPWSAELKRLFLLLAAALLVGLPFGHAGLLLTVTLAAYLAWHLRNLFNLYAWLRNGHSFHPPEAGGIWGEVFHQLYRRQIRNRKRKRRLASLIKRFQEAAAAMPDATVILDVDGAIEWFNDAAVQLLGLQPGKDVGQRIINLIRYPEFVRYVSREHSSSSEPLRMPIPNNDTLMLNVRMVPYGNEQHLLLARDISQQQRLEQMRRDFVANVSHELRTPLTVVAGFLETLLEEEHPDYASRSLELMQQQTQRMQHIVDDLLLLSRLETDRTRPTGEVVSVPAVLAMIEEGVEPLVQQKNQRMRFECDPGLSIFGAEKELYSAFSNLVTNAVRYTPDGGTINVRWFRDERGAHLEVEDSGVGIAPQHIPRLTERFYRVDVGRSRDTGGTGLGLAIVKHVVNRHEGTLRINSMLNKGSTFCVDFPSSLIAGNKAA
jgi:two-component system phosphate regulon sensor histidine kinase PhoR